MTKSMNYKVKGWMNHNRILCAQRSDKTEPVKSLLGIKIKK